MTRTPGILLGVRVADCLPVLLVDRKKRAIAAVHAGWRGMLGRIIEKAAGEMRRTYGSRPEDLLAAVGPSIRACCYEVGKEVVEAFLGRFAAAEEFFQIPSPRFAASRVRRPGTLLGLQAPPGHSLEKASHAHLDLVAAARQQLALAGVRRPRVYVANYCTACRGDLFFSYRREGSRAGRMAAVMGVSTLG